MKKVLAVAQLINGSLQIYDPVEDAPLVTFHGPRAQEMADLFAQAAEERVQFGRVIVEAEYIMDAEAQRKWALRNMPEIRKARTAYDTLRS